MKKLCIIMIILTIVNICGAWEIKENPDRFISSAIIIDKKNTDLTYDYFGWRYLLLNMFPYCDTTKQFGKSKSVLVGVDLIIPYSSNVTIYMKYTHININSNLDEIPFKIYGLNINEYGKNISFSLRYYFK